MRHVVVDADGEAALRFVLLQLVEHRLGHRGIEVLRRESVAAGDDRGHRLDAAGRERLGKRRDHVQVERVARPADFLRAIEHRDAAHGGRQRRKKTCLIPRAIEQHLQHAHPLAVRVQPGCGFVEDLERRSDHNRHAIGLGMTAVAEQLVRPADDGADLVHRALHDVGHAGVIRRARLAGLEERIRIVRRAPDHGTLGRERAGPVRPHQVLVDRGSDLLVRNDGDRVLFMRRAEAVEEEHAPARGLRVWPPARPARDRAIPGPRPR